MRRLKTEKGITLIALIITIVVLLILAGVAIGTLEHSNIIGRAQEAASKYESEKVEENKTIKDTEELLEKYATGTNEPNEYSFTLNELGQYEVGDGGAWILYNLSEFWKVVGKNLLEEDKYFTILDELPSAIIEADDNRLGNLLHYLGKVEITEEIQCNVLTLFVEEENVFIISPMDKNGDNLLGSAESGKMTVEEFVNKYGNVKFTFRDTSILQQENITKEYIRDNVKAVLNIEGEKHEITILFDGEVEMGPMEIILVNNIENYGYTINNDSGENNLLYVVSKEDNTVMPFAFSEDKTKLYQGEVDNENKVLDITSDCME